MIIGATGSYVELQRLTITVANLLKQLKGHPLGIKCIKSSTAVRERSGHLQRALLLYILLRRQLNSKRMAIVRPGLSEECA